MNEPRNTGPSTVCSRSIRTRPFQSAGLFFLAHGEMGLDLGAALIGERPGARLERHIQPIEPKDGDRSHRASYNGSARKLALGFANSSCASISAISPAPSSAVRLRMPNTDAAARDSASATAPSAAPERK